MCKRLVIGCVLSVSVALAQSNVGQIAGKVFDPSGAVVPQSQITLREAGTGFTRTTTSDAAGYYIFPALPAGVYDLRAEAVGFRALERKGIVLDAASRRVVDLTLEVGPVSEAVSVTAAVEQVQLSSGEVARLISDRQLSNLALNGRNYAQLLRLIPGAVATTVDPFNLGLSTTGQRINGIRSNSIYFLMDGVDNMDNGGNSNAIVNPNLDAIAEIKILTSSYSAEFGGRAGAMINVVTKSGTREFHGSLFEFVRNDAWDARSFFAREMPPLRFNDFGWTLGGPFFIPGKFNADRQKVFFFAGQEWKYNHLGETRLSMVPTAAERAGDFRESSLAAPRDPLAGNQPFPDRRVPPARFSKNGPALLKPYPLPNFSGPGGNLSRNGVSRTDTREDLLRVDYYLSSKTQLMYRWTHDEWDIWNAFQGGNTGIIPGGRPRPGFTTVASISHTLSPTSLNYFSFSVTANQIKGSPRNEALRRDVLGLTYPEVFPVNQCQVGPNLNVAGFTGYTVGDRIQNLNTTFQWRDDFSRVIGSHAVKFGAQITRSRKDQNRSGGNDNGTVTFNTSAARTSRNVIADVLLGNFQSYTEGQQDSWWWARFNQWEFYAQDSWRAHRRLTLELGLRYNIIGPIYSALGNFTTFAPRWFDRSRLPLVNPADGAILAPGDPYNGIVIFGSGFPKAAQGRLPEAADPALRALFRGLPRGGFQTNYRNFGPRFGFALDPGGSGKVAIRGGFGIFYDLMRTDYLGGTSGNPPFALSASIYDGNIDNPAGGAARKFPPSLSAIAERMPAPMVISYNLGYQRQLPGEVVMDLSYVGTLGRRLTRTRNINQLREGTRLNPPYSTMSPNALRPYLGYADISMQENADNSNYNSLQVAFNRRLSRGLTFGVSYTFARTLDTTGGSPQNAYFARADYGLSSIHRKHVLNFNYVYELPWLRRHRIAWIRQVFGGWDVSGITFYQSGAPNSVTVPVDVARIGVSSSRATVIADPVLPKSERTLARWFNTEAFLPPERMPPGRFGNSGRNILIGPGFNQWDLALLKNFRLGETRALQFRAESFNVWNHPSFTGINTTVRFDAQGRPTQNYGAVNASGPGRVLEFGLKLLF